MNKIVISLALLSGTLFSILLAILFIGSGNNTFLTFSFIIGLLCTALQAILVYSIYEDKNQNEQ